MILFAEDAVPVLLKAWSGATEKAPEHGETKVVKVTFDIPLTSERASNFQPGDGEVKNVVFKAATDGTIRPFLRDSVFNMKLGAQRLTIQSTPDSPAVIAFDHVKFMKTVTVRSCSKEANLLLKATIGPCGPSEYAFLGAWQNSQRFVTFEESEPALAMDDDERSDGESARAVTNDGPIPQAPMWDDAEEQAAVDASRDAKATEQAHRYPKKSKKGSRKAKDA